MGNQGKFTGAPGHKRALLNGRGKEVKSSRPTHSRHYYLLGRAVTLYSDPAPLQWLHRMKDFNERMTRWYLALQPLNFRVVHRPGAQMALADFLRGSELAAGCVPGLCGAVGVCWGTCGVCPAGGVWACWKHTGSAGLVGSDCEQVPAIRPIRECALMCLLYLVVGEREPGRRTIEARGLLLQEYSLDAPCYRCPGPLVS